MNNKKPLKLNTLLTFMAILVIPFILLVVTFYISQLLGPDGDGLRFVLGVFSIAGLFPWVILAFFTFAYALKSIFHPENSRHRTVAIISLILLSAAFAFFIYAIVSEQ